MTTEKEVMEKLKSIIDPHTRIDVVTMGLVQKIEIDERAKKIRVIFKPTSSFCPMVKHFDQKIREVIKDLGYEPEVEILR